MEITYDGNIDILDIKYTAGSSTGSTLPPGIYELSYFKLMLKPSPPAHIEGNITIDDIRLRSNLTNKKH